MPLPATCNAIQLSKTLSSGGVNIQNGVAGVCIVDTGSIPSNVLAALTWEARKYLARSVVEGLRLKVIGFQVGAGGYDPTDPTQASPIDIYATKLQDQFFPSPLAIPNYEAVDNAQQPNDTAMAFLCRCASGEANRAWGEVCLIAEITASPVNPAEIGTVFMFCVGHTPIQAKTANHVYNFRLVVQFGT